MHNRPNRGSRAGAYAPPTKINIYLFLGNKRTVQIFQMHSKSKWSRVFRDSTLRNNSTLTQLHLGTNIYFVYTSTSLKIKYDSVWIRSLLEHILEKMGSTEIVMSSVRPSVRPSVRYFSAGIAPRELKI
jgi:hypothetical protein